MKQGPQPNVASSSAPPGGTELSTSAATTVPAGGAATGSGISSWTTQWAGLRSQMEASMQRLRTQLQEAGKSWKAPDLSKGLGMKVDIDLLNPTITGLKQQWQQLPEPVREVMPFAGVALFAGVGVQRMYQEQLDLAHSRYGHLRSDHEELQSHLRQLESQLEDINMRRSGAYLEIQMTEAIAKAATAAAAAAAAAASAASACVPVQQQQQPQQPLSQQQQQQPGLRPAPRAGAASGSADRGPAAAPQAQLLPGGQPPWHWQWGGDETQVPAAASGILYQRAGQVMPVKGDTALMADAASDVIVAGSTGASSRRGVLGFKLPRLPVLMRCHGNEGSDFRET